GEAGRDGRHGRRSDSGAAWWASPKRPAQPRGFETCERSAAERAAQPRRSEPRRNTMRLRVGELLVQSGAIGVRRLEEAYRRQIVYGGALDTVLLEMNAVEEPRLRAVLALASGRAAGQGRGGRARGAAAGRRHECELARPGRGVRAHARGAGCGRGRRAAADRV